jgi:hypothetical protein
LYKTNWANPDGTIYSNIIPGNPVFGYQGFQAALDILASMKDENGEPIELPGTIHLVITQGMEALARQMFNADWWEQTVAGVGTVRLDNPFKGRVQVHINPYIATTATLANGTTSWFIFMDPQSGRPAVEMGFLAGHEQPELFLKAADQIKIGGGTNVMNGDFNTDMLKTKCRMFIGGGSVDPRSTVASNGSGS